MSDNVQSLRGEPIAALGKPNPAVIQTLENQLEKARSGNIVGIAWVALHDDEATSFNWQGTADRRLLGTIPLLNHEIIKALSGEDQ